MEQKIALYLRSSMEQSESSRNIQNPDESDTIANQRKLLYKAIHEKGLSSDTVAEYIDDGHTGVNFNRPAFKQLIEDTNNGMISTVIVKDFSRLGRDYIGVGEYMEQYFPIRGVRFISVNDGWDSDEHVGETLELDAAFRTMIYDMYSKDLSIKRKSANQARHKSGIFIGAFVPFGYKKDPEDIHKYVVDERTAPIVKRVFQLFLAGEKIGNIAKIFNQEGVISPARAKEEMHSYETVTKNPDLWSERAVHVILKNEMYTGTLVLNRFAIKGLRSKTCIKTDENEWIKFPNNHEAIISLEEFKEAQKRFSKKKDVIVDNTNAGRGLPLYCGHCGMKLRSTTRNEGTYVCQTGNMSPYEPCGQMLVRRNAAIKMIVKAINKQAKVLADRVKNNMASSKEVEILQKTFSQLEAELREYHEKRMGLYKSFKAGAIDRDNFLKRKAEILKQEEEALAEYEDVNSKLEATMQWMEQLQAESEAFNEYAFLSEYDSEVVHHLISKVECYNDGHIKIVWNYKSEFKEAGAIDITAAEALPDEKYSQGKVAVYTSDLWLMPQEEHYSVAQTHTMNYCLNSLQIPKKNIAIFHDDKSDEGVFYRLNYMKFIDEGREGNVEALVINSFKDLYLSCRDLENLLRFIIPRLPCRFIAVADDFDSDTADDEKYKEIYNLYGKTRKGDLMKYRAIERKQGKRVAEKPKNPQCTLLYGYHIKEDGCYADPEVLAFLPIIYDKLSELKNLWKVACWLNEQKIPTMLTFFNKDGIGTPERVKKWDREKVWNAIKRDGYITYCQHYERCMELGKHCDRKPIIDKDLFYEVNTKYAYRKNRCKYM